MSSLAGKSAHEQSLLSVREGYRLWSRVYDSQPNPMLALEERCLEPLIGDIRGKFVLDAGCGSGRWLRRLQSGGSKRVIGIDCSPEMLAGASARDAGASLALATCELIPLGSHVADLVLSSFMLGYAASLVECAAELARVTVPGGTVIVSDLHPETAVRYGWQRSFSFDQQNVAIASHFWTIEDVMDAFECVGFRLAFRLEPCFAEADLHIFEQAGKSKVFHALSGEPAIVILMFHAGAATRNIESVPRHPTATRAADPVCPPLFLRGARVAKSAYEATVYDLQTDGHRIVGHQGAFPEAAELDLGGYLLLPGLINAHDHLEFALFPRLGSGRYRNSREWADEIYRPSEPPVRDHLSISKTTRLWWGSIRNLLAGVTTVCHHNPFVPEVFNQDFPVDVLREFGWAHSLTFDPDVAAHAAATPPGAPFIVHLAEGVDGLSEGELRRLDALCRVNHLTVVVHGLGLSAQGRNFLRRRGAALVWCPGSNIFLFGRTLSPQELADIERVGLGTDSSLTSVGDMLDEVRLAHECGVDPFRLYGLVTSGGADLLGLSNGEGALLPGALANLVALRDRDATPAETLVASTFRDVALVTRRGRVQLVSDELFPRLPDVLTAGLHPLLVEDHLCWLRAPLGKLFRGAVEALGCDLRLGGKEIRNVSAEFI